MQELAAGQRQAEVGKLVHGPPVQGKPYTACLLTCSQPHASTQGVYFPPTALDFSLKVQGSWIHMEVNKPDDVMNAQSYASSKEVPWIRVVAVAEPFEARDGWHYHAACELPELCYHLQLFES